MENIGARVVRAPIPAGTLIPRRVRHGPIVGGPTGTCDLTQQAPFDGVPRSSITLPLMAAKRVPRGREEHRISSGVATLSWDGPTVTLYLEDVESSAINVEHPDQLVFEYMQQMTAALDSLIPGPQWVHALHLGAAGCALPWAWDVMRPGSRQVAVEVDAELARQVREWFDLPRSPALRIRVGDGREVLASTRPASMDVIVRDAFAHGDVPPHLTTLDSATQAARALRPGGLYLMNCPHGGGADGRADVAAALATFPEVHLITDPKVLRSGRIGNIVIVARATSDDSTEHSPCDLADLERRLRRLPLPARVWSGAEVIRWVAGAKPRTDAEVNYPPRAL